MSRGGVAAVAAAALVVLLLATTGCAELGYYAQSTSGHLDLVRRARPAQDWLSDEATPAALRDRLQLAQRLRDFAVAELKLPDNRSYRSYADLGRPYAVWNVVAAPELSLTLQTWCFPVMGCVGYRGYFDAKAAEAMAGQLRERGLEVSVYGVPAYSTLGWTNWLGGDPLLNTFIGWSEAELARLIFHELAHQVAYAKDDTVFNESFATAVERIGGARWLATQATPGAREEYARFDRRRQDFRALTMAYRDRLEALYGAAASDADKRDRKAALMAQMRAEHDALKAQRWGGFAGYDGWFARANNASFGVLAAYNALVPDFDRLFQRSGGDFARFYAEVRRLAALPKAERRAALSQNGD